MQTILCFVLILVYIDWNVGNVARSTISNKGCLEICPYFVRISSAPLYIAFLCLQQTLYFPSILQLAQYTNKKDPLGINMHQLHLWDTPAPLCIRDTHFNIV
jgi:hypothetical protein